MNEKDYFKHFLPFFSQSLKRYKDDPSTCVIIVYAWIEAQLTKLLSDRFVDSDKGESLEKYQSWEKIDIAHKLGIISDDCLRDLITVRTIRNRCAHCKLTIDKDIGRVQFHWNKDSVDNLAANIIKYFQKFIEKYKEYRPLFPDGEIGEVVMVMVAMLTELIVSKGLKFQHLDKPEKEKFYII